MNISESILSHQDFCYFLARIMTNIDEYPSCKKLLLSGIHLIGQDDLILILKYSSFIDFDCYTFYLCFCIFSFTLSQPPQKFLQW